jgi:hypothetical protein
MSETKREWFPLEYSRVRVLPSFVFNYLDYFLIEAKPSHHLPSNPDDFARKLKQKIICNKLFDSV